jgi:hypothetical protein
MKRGPTAQIRNDYTLYHQLLQIDDAGNPFAATGLCFEVAEALVTFQKYSEAATYFQVSYCLAFFNLNPHIKS